MSLESATQKQHIDAVQEQPQMDDDLFDAAFDAAVSPESEDVQDDVKDPEIGKVEETSEAVQDDVKDTEVGKVEETSEAVQDDVKDTEVDQEEVSKEVKKSKKDSTPVVANHVPSEEEIKVAEERQRKIDEDRQAAEKAALAEEQYTEDEQKLLEDLKENFPEVAEAFEPLRRVIEAKVRNDYRRELQGVVSNLVQHINPILSSAQSMAVTDHQRTILNAHPDAYEIVPQVEEFIKTQPSYLHKAYNDVLDNGTAQQIIELYDFYKKSNNQTGSQIDVERKAKELADKKVKEEKLKSLEGITGRNTDTKSDVVDPYDFDGAFNKFAGA